MSAFLEQLARDAAAAVEVLGEWITYTPYGGQAKQILAIIERDVPAEVDGVAHGGAWKHRIWIVNDALRGMTSITRDGDVVSFPNFVGGVVQSFPVKRIVSQDQGMWALGVG